MLPIASRDTNWLVLKTGMSIIEWILMIAVPNLSLVVDNPLKVDFIPLKIISEQRCALWSLSASHNDFISLLTSLEIGSWLFMEFSISKRA